MKKRYVVKISVFVIVFSVIFNYVSRVVTVPSDYRNYQWIRGFYEEPEKSLDAVYIGSSNCYAFWNPLVAWKDYGIAVYPYACNSLPFLATEYMIKEARKTQPDALFIVNLNTISDKKLTIPKLHYLLDYMPLSLNKLAMTKYLSEISEISLKESIELYIPIVRYHTRWNDLDVKDFEYKIDGLKGASTYSTYIKGVEDISYSYEITDEKMVLSDIITDNVESLLDYCDRENINILFITVPRAEANIDVLKRCNSLEQIILERGYPVLDLTDNIEDIGLNLKKDYYNDTHTNIKGSIKYTHYLSKYLIEEYGFVDKRGNNEYSSWDYGVHKYDKTVVDIY